MNLLRCYKKIALNGTNRKFKVGTVALVSILMLGCSDKIDNANVKELLIQLLKNPHTNQEWFVPTKIAIAGLTEEQSNWKGNTSNHSVAELVSHLILWNETNLKAFKAEDSTNWDNDHELTFNKFTETDWEKTAKKLDSIQTEWERIIEKASEKQIDE